MKKLITKDVNQRVELVCPSRDRVFWYYEKNGNYPISPPFHTKPIFTIENLENKHTGFIFCFGYSGKEYFLSRTLLMVFGNLNIRILGGWSYVIGI